MPLTDELPGRPTARQSENGASLIEYGGVVLLVAAIAAVVISAGLPGQVSGLISDAVDCVLTPGECDTSDEPAASDDDSNNPATDEDPPDTPSPQEPASDLGGEMVDQPAELTSGTMDGAGEAACMAMACGPDEARATWANVADTAASANPAVWDSEESEADVGEVFFSFGDDNESEGDAPGPDTAPDDVNDWWEGLSEAEREEVIQEESDNVRNLDGIPAEVRDDLNREFLEDEVNQRLAEEQERRGDDPFNRDDLLNLELEDVENDQRMLELWELANLEETVNSDDEYHVLSLDPDDERAVVSKGNPDTADNVSTMVPGMGIEWTAINGQLGRAETVQRAAESHDEDADTASIAFIGYDTPNQAQTLSSSHAEAGAEEVQDFQEGLRLTHEGAEPSNNTVIGHSYGSLTVGTAAADDDGLDADNIIFTGSPGTKVDSVNEFNGVDEDNVHATRGDDDNGVGAVPDFYHGRDPTDEEDYGANVFESDIGTGHTDYFDNPRSSQGRYIGAVINGDQLDRYGR